MKGVFIDSDVLLDILLEREEFNEVSILSIEKCLDLEFKLYFTSVIITNIYFIARKENGDKMVRKQIKDLLKHINVLDIKKESILKALDSNFKDFEDALQNYSAEASGKIDTIITRNIKDYKYSQLAVMSPELFLKSAF